jgi:hypothetical protein
LSAVATNGKISSGGPYFIISRNLSVKLGSSIGLLYYIGTTIATSMYICGACEIFLKFMFQNKVSIYGDISESTAFFWNVRFYGTIWLVILGMLVFVGVKFVSKISPIALAAVLISIIAVFVGVFSSIFYQQDVDLCLLGDRLLMSDSYTLNNKKYCTKNKFCFSTNSNNETEQFLCPLYKVYCSEEDIEVPFINLNQIDGINIDETVNCDFFWIDNQVTSRPAFPGFPKTFFSKIFNSNF